MALARRKILAPRDGDLTNGGGGRLVALGGGRVEPDGHAITDAGQRGRTGDERGWLIVLQLPVGRPAHESNPAG